MGVGGGVVRLFFGLCRESTLKRWTYHITPQQTYFIPAMALDTIGVFHFIPFL